MVQNNPIEQVREKERAANQRRMAAEQVGESIVQKALEDAKELQAEATERGKQSGRKAVDQGLEKARKAADTRIASAEAQVAGITARSEALMQQSVEWALALVLPDESGGA